MGRYPISREFGIYRYMKTPVMPAKIAGIMGSLMRPPRWIRHDGQIAVRSCRIAGYGGDPVEVLVMEPRGLSAAAPCLVYYHGGGFVFGAAGAHYQVAKQYALGARCKVIFVQYRLCPRYPFPVPAEDAYLAYLWAVEHAEELHIDRSRTAIGGDSAGGCLCAAVTQMCRDRGAEMPLFQMMIYPVTDRRMGSDSNKRFTDTPMWHSRLSARMWQSYLQDASVEHIEYASPLEAARFDGLPPAYVELAEYDCLHDEGFAYAQKLREAGVRVVLHETKGTMHGYDIAMKVPTVRKAIKHRIRYMNRKFYGAGG